MKLNKILLITVSGMLPVLAFGAASGTSKSESGRVDVQFLVPENYTDVRSSLMDPGDRNGYLDQLRDHVVKLSTEYLPEGLKLQFTFKDIDLAGDFPPGRSAAANDVRVMKDIYPPRMVLSYRVTDASGKIVKQGDETLTDNNYLTTGRLTNRSDLLRYDKTLMSDWYRRTFSRN